MALGDGARRRRSAMALASDDLEVLELAAFGR